MHGEKGHPVRPTALLSKFPALAKKKKEALI